MTITATAGGGANSATSLPLTMPAVPDGQLVVIGAQASTGTLTAPAVGTWAELLNVMHAGGRVALWTHVSGADGPEPGSYTVTASSSTSAAALTALASSLGGTPAVAVGPLVDGAGSASGTSVSPTITPPGIADTLLCWFMGRSTGARTVTVPPSMTEAVNSGSGLRVVAAAIEQLYSGAATGTRTATFSASVSAWLALSLILTEPAPPAGAGSFFFDA